MSIHIPFEWALRLFSLNWIHLLWKWRKKLILIGVATTLIQRIFLVLKPMLCLCIFDRIERIPKQKPNEFSHTHKHTRIQARISIVRKIGYYMFHVYLFVFKSLLCIYEISICTHSISKSTAEIEKKHTTIKMTVFLLQRIHVLYIMFIKFLRWRVYLSVKSSMQSIPCRFNIFFIRSNASTISTALKFRINRDRGVFNAICYCSCLLCKTDEQHSIVVCVCVSYLCIWLSISVYLELFMSFSRSKSFKQLIQYTFGKDSFFFF